MITVYSDTHYIQHANVDNQPYLEFVQVFDEAMFTPLPPVVKLAFRRMIHIPQQQEWNVKQLEGMLFDNHRIFVGNLFEFFTLTLTTELTPMPVLVHRDDLHAIAPLLQSLQTLSFAYYQRKIWLHGVQQNWAKWVVCFGDTLPDPLSDKQKLYPVRGDLITERFPLSEVYQVAKQVADERRVFRVECSEKQAIVSDPKQSQSQPLKLLKPVHRPCVWYATLDKKWPVISAKSTMLYVEEKEKVMNVSFVWKVDNVELHYSIAPTWV